MRRGVKEIAGGRKRDRGGERGRQRVTPREGKRGCKTVD